MRVLLDTHAFLWFALDDPQLSKTGRELIADSDNEILFSPASYWEIAIKISLGKYHLDEDFRKFMERQIAENDLILLPITVAQVAVVTTLPFHHKDPFDRLLIAQAITEEIPLLSADKVFDKYPVTRIW